MSKKTENWSAIIQSVLLPALIGLTAGISGGMIAQAYFSFSVYQVPQPLTFGRSPSAVTAPLPEVEIAERLNDLNLPIFAKASIGRGELANRAVLQEKAIGMAVAITSDGWLLTHRSVLKGPVLIGVGGKLMEPIKRIDDPATGAVFLKVDNGLLHVTGFEETERMRPGTPLYLEDAGGRFSKAFYSDVRAPSGTRSSDAFSRVFLLDREFDKAASGGAVVTAGGNLAGILSSDGFIPMHLIRSVLSDAFRSQELSRSKLGVRYIDLSSIYVAGDPTENSVGARLTGYRAKGLLAIKPGSAAAIAGLKEGDIILRVDDTELTNGTDLAEVIADYRPGTKVKFEFLRGEERRFVEVVLK